MLSGFVIPFDTNVLSQSDTRSSSWSEDEKVTLDGAWFVRGGLLDPVKLNRRNYQKSRQIDVMTPFKAMGFKQVRTGRGSVTYYRLLKNLPSNYQFGMRYRADTSSKVYFYRVGSRPSQVAEFGKVTNNPRHHFPQLIDPLVKLKSQKKGDYFIVIQVQNYFYDEGGIWRAPTLDSWQEAEKTWQIELLSEIFTIGMIFILTAYNFVLFFYRREDYANFWLSVFCTCVLLRATATSGKILPIFFTEPNLDVYSFQRWIEFSSGQMLTGSVLGFVLYSFYPGRFRSFFTFQWILIFGTVVAAFLLPLHRIRQVVIPMDVLIAIGGAFVFYLAVAAVVTKKPGASIYLAGCIVVLVTGVNDILLGLKVLDEGSFLIHYGTAFFIFCLGQVVAKKFALAFRTSRRLSIHLEEEVSIKTKDIRSILDNIPQGILTIGEGEIIHPNYSKFLETITGTNHISGMKIQDLIFRSSDMSPDKIDIALASIRSSIGEFSFNFDVNIDHLPKDVRYTSATGEKKYLRFTWSAIANSQDIIYKIMLAVKDVTELRVFEEENRLQKREIGIIEEIIDVQKEKFFHFIDESLEFIERCSRLLVDDRDEQNTLRELFIKLHTLKGISRAHGFKAISNQIHLAEDHIQSQVKQSRFEKDVIEKNLDELRETIIEYRDIANRRLHYNVGTKTDYTGNREFIAAQAFQLQQLNSDGLDGENKQILESVLSSLNDALFRDLRKGVEETFSSVEEIAVMVGKEPPHVTYSFEESIGIVPDVLKVLNHCFVHVIRNSLDHGIESSEDRIKKGKPSVGSIYLDVYTQESWLMINYSDDGRGLDLEAVLHRAIREEVLEEGKSYPAAEIADCIFRSGVTTARKVTDISGRGVGMDAVRSFMRNLGGEVSIDVRDVTSGSFCTFSLVFAIPSHLFQSFGSSSSDEINSVS